jgi:hypothetical protein
MTANLHPGATVVVPGIGAVIVATVGKRYFTGTTPDGAPVGLTGNGIIAREGLYK